MTKPKIKLGIGEEESVHVVIKEGSIVNQYSFEGIVSCVGIFNFEVFFLDLYTWNISLSIRYIFSLETICSDAVLQILMVRLLHHRLVII